MLSQRSSPNCASECEIGVSVPVVSLLSLFFAEARFVFAEARFGSPRKWARASGYFVSRSTFGSELYAPLVATFEVWAPETAR
jgi:hypothetical protein